MPALPNEQGPDDFKPQGPENRKTPIELMAPAELKTPLGHYRLLSPTAAVRVSPICLGSMSLGDQWTGFMGADAGYAKAEKYLDTYYELGGNFIDTANNYQDEQSEHIIGAWMEKRGIRDEIVLATKYTTFYLDRAQGRFDGVRANFGGNSKKSLHISVDRSLKKLRTTYIDLLYLHWWDYSTSIPEVMRGLDDLVKSGKVLYIGVSDTPAWIVAQANEYARQHGLTQFSVYQGSWNLLQRDMERDIIPMCRANGMSIAPYSVMGAGLFRTPEELKERGAKLRGGFEPSEAHLKLSKVLQEIAQELGENVNLAHVGLAWARQMVTDCFPIIGGTNPANIKSNTEALNIHLTDAQMAKLDAAAPADLGFPYALFGRDPHDLPDGKPDGFLLNTVRGSGSGLSDWTDKQIAPVKFSPRP